MKKKNTTLLDETRAERKALAEDSFISYVELIQPKRVLGNIHREVMGWWTASNAKSHMLLLPPRDHMKSALVGLWTSWMLTRDPTLRISYISSTSNLATKQLKFIKDILTSDIYRMYWPEMVHPEEAKREKWTEREISVDHPLRKGAIS